MIRKALDINRLNPGRVEKTVWAQRVVTGGDLRVERVRTVTSRQKLVKLRPDIAEHRVRLASTKPTDEAGPGWTIVHRGGLVKVLPTLAASTYTAGDRRRRRKAMRPVVEQAKPVSRRQAKRERTRLKLAKRTADLILGCNAGLGIIDEPQAVSVGLAR